MVTAYVRLPVAAVLLAAAGAWAQSGAPVPSRGELLYGTHCGACHGVQMHWRDRKLATDWPSLRAQVQRWQAIERLDWSAQDVDEVARFLNATIYRLPEPARVISRVVRDRPVAAGG